MANDHGEQIRIVQETVAGKEITFAHVMGGPAPVIYQKLGLNPQLDYRSYCSKERKCISWLCRPLYRNTDHYRRDF